MRRQIYDDERAPSRTLAARLHKAELEACGDIRCGYCRYHRGENRTHHSPHADVKKRNRDVAIIAAQIFAGMVAADAIEEMDKPLLRERKLKQAVAFARAIVAETIRTEPNQEPSDGLQDL